MNFKLKTISNGICIEFHGHCDWTLNKKSQKALMHLISSHQHVILDFSSISLVDFVFCSFICRLLDGKDFEIIGANTQINDMFHLLCQTLDRQKLCMQSESLSTGFYPKVLISLFISIGIGKKIYRFYETFLNFLQFCGGFLLHFFTALVHPRRFQYRSILYYINESGFKALPIVFLTAFIVSYAIALQGVLQLQKMGVPMMSVEIVAKLSLREMGPFILAIVIAGRSSSSFSAQIGVMNITEENDALKTMNLSLYDYLVLPRILALVIVMPLLVFLADAISLFGAMIAVKMHTGINFIQYLERFYEYVGINNFWIGVVKAPFFGLAIGLVGCFRGLYIKGNAESLGLETTKSVVNAIFWIILINAIFSIITTRLDI